jgi:hypothetical protein
MRCSSARSQAMKAMPSVSTMLNKTVPTALRLGLGKERQGQAARWDHRSPTYEESSSQTNATLYCHGGLPTRP